MHQCKGKRLLHLQCHVSLRGMTMNIVTRIRSTTSFPSCCILAAQATVLNKIASNAARPAESAAEAACALREAQERPRNSFREASMVVSCPEFFSYTTSDEDQNNCRDFPFSFKAWLVFADAEFDRELALIERASKIPMSLPTDAGTLQRAYKLYAILSRCLDTAL